MNKGYAFGFLIVLLVVILGMYVAFTGFVSTREALRAQATAAPTSAQAQVTEVPTDIPTLTPTPGIMVLPTPLPGITATLTAIASTPVQVPTDAPLPTDAPEVLPTNPPPTATNTPSPVPQPPTPVPVPAYAFRVAAPPGPDPAYPSCCYLFGTVRDAAGNFLENVQVKAFNEWTELPPAATKVGAEAGQYNIPIGSDLITWYVIVVDAAGNQISPQVAVPFNSATMNGYRIDWQRTY